MMFELRPDSPPNPTQEKPMNCNSSTCFRLYKYAKETRDAQKQYFRTRDSHDLRTCKALERELDEAIDNYARVVLNNQPPQPTQPTLI